MCSIIILLLIIGIVWLYWQQEEDFTLPFAGGYVYDQDYGGMADKEVEADSLMT